MFYARHRHNDEENLSITYKKKACDFDHSPQRCGRIKNEEEKKRRVVEREQEKKFPPTQPPPPLSLSFFKRCVHTAQFTEGRVRKAIM